MIQGYFQKDSQCEDATLEEYEQPNTVTRKFEDPVLVPQARLVPIPPLQRTLTAQN